MAKPASTYVCQECGSAQRKWAGQCPDCGGWNSMVEEASISGFSKSKKASAGSLISLEDLKGKAENAPRVNTGVAELNQVLGGGLVKGSAILIGGDPGIGKSTLLLQVVAGLAGQGLETVYITGEESVDQVRLRAQRLGVADASVKIAAATSVDDMLESYLVLHPR